MCLYPSIIKNKRYSATKKNKGIIPECKDDRLKGVPVKCGKCIECLKDKAREWQVRLSVEMRNDKSQVQFITMTFSDEAMKKLGSKAEYGDNEMAKKAVNKFIDRWKHKHGKAVKHWLITERGQKGSERIHLHGFLWTTKTTTEIEQIWKYGWVDTGEYVNQTSVNYCVKYVYKGDPKHDDFRAKIFATKGLGKMTETMESFYKFRGSETKESYILENGRKIAMPEYYKRRLWTDEEREELRIKQLNEGILYVNGIKCEVKTEDGKRIYHKRLLQRRRDCESMGYKLLKKNDDNCIKKTLKFFGE